MGPFLLYDAGCRTCRAFALLVARLSVHAPVHRIPLDAPLTKRLLHAVPMSERHRSFHLVLADGTTHSAGAAVVRLLEFLPARSLLRLTLRHLRWLEPSIVRLYGVLATRKLRVACGQASLGCAVPPGLDR